MSNETRRTGGGPLPAPIDHLQEALRSYFDGGLTGATHDPLTRVLDGFIVHVEVKSWSGWVKLGAEDLGLSSSAYESLALRWGGINLLPEHLRSQLHSTSTQMRKLPIHMGRTVQQWGRYIPIAAMPHFRRAFDALKETWDATVQDWIDNYDAYRTVATDAIQLLADRASHVAAQLGEPYFSDIDAMEWRLLSTYPAREELADRLTARYEVSFIPTPTAVAEQTAQLEVIEREKAQRLEHLRQEAERRQYEHEAARLRALNAIDVETAKHQEKLRVIQEERARLQGEFEQQRRALLDDFYSGYALDIRQRLHEALMFVVEGVRKGKMSPSAGRSLRTVLDEIRTLALDDDAEIQQMRARLQELMGDAGKVKAEDLKDQIEDVGVLLQTSILALGEQPRIPKRRGQPIDVPEDILADLPADAADFRETVRRARQRVGLDSSLAEVLVDAGQFTPNDLRQRRRRLDEERPIE